MTAIAVTVNGTLHEADVPARLLLADFLRDSLGLTGTKIGCGTGVCGACTVHVDGEPVLACTHLAVQAAGRHVRTIEELAPEGELHPLQRAFQATHALQCGHCTPGVLMALAPLVESGQTLDEAEIREALAGNLCRCTGYEPIVEAVLDAARR